MRKHTPQVYLIRVGTDKNRKSGGIYAPIFRNRSFVYIPIPEWDEVNRSFVHGVKPMYGTEKSKSRHLSEYFPGRRRDKMKDVTIHFDPEFQTFTFGDFAPSLSKLSEGDLLVFYAGLRPDGFDGKEGMYIIGYFDIKFAKEAKSMTPSALRSFRNNSHCNTTTRDFDKECSERLVLVKGKPGPRSRLLKRAVIISADRRKRTGQRLVWVLSPKAARRFGPIGKMNCIERKGPHPVCYEKAEKAAVWIRKKLR